MATLMAALAAACTPDADSDGPGERGAKHLILISLDTVRADHLGCYGATGARTPHIDALAAAGVRFDSVMAAAPTTLASHASLLTGTYPQTHGVPRNGYVLDPANLTLAEVLSHADFATLAAVGAFPLAGAFGLGQGFEHYDDTLGHAPEGAGYAERDAAAVTDAALALVDGELERRPERRLFLFVHYFDAHAPHVPPAPFDRAFERPAGWEARGIPQTLAEGVVRAADDHYQALIGQRPGRGVVVRGLAPEWIETADGQALGLDNDLDALYRGELAYIDDQLGRLLDGLERRGLLRDAAVIVTADHGETKWEHADYWNHGLALFETSVHIPLIVRGATSQATLWAPRSVPQPVSNIDIAPTATALLGIDVPPRMEGVDLMDLFGNPTADRGPIFSEATMPFGVERPDGAWPNGNKPHAVRQGPWKYVRWNYNDHEQLFDLSEDPGERHNLLWGTVQPADRERARTLAATLARWRASAQPHSTVYRAGRDADMLRTLNDMGYGGED